MIVFDSVLSSLLALAMSGYFFQAVSTVYKCVLCNNISSYIYMCFVVQKDQNLFSHDISNSLLCFYVVLHSSVSLYRVFGMAHRRRETHSVRRKTAKEISSKKEQIDTKYSLTLLLL